MFSYLRIFAIFSLLAVILISWLAGMSFRSLAIEDLTRLVERNTTGLAQGYTNTVWKRYRDVIVPLAQDPSKLRGNAQVGQFAQETVGYFDHMPLIKVNIYSNKGALLMSNNVESGILLANNAASPDSQFVLEHMPQVGSASQLLQDVNLEGIGEAALVQTIVPIRLQPGSGPPDGALELLYDMRLLWSKLVNFQIYSVIGVTAVFIMLLIILFLTAKKAESIISKQYEANAELAATAAAAQAENRDKSQFLANISHELRTPLNAIIGFSEIIKNEVIANLNNKKYTDYISDIHTSGVHLLSLINDILDYSKAEAGKLELEVSEVNTTKIIQNCIRLLETQAKTANVKLTEAMPKDAFILFTDNKKFKQIVLNLLSNAIKFTPAGGEVRLTAWQNIADESFSFEVRDTGIGIAPKDISLALAPFGQVDNTLSRKYEGTGLGLPLTKKFVELMGGKFILSSEVNVGTTITFTLPRELKPRDGVILKQVS